LANPQLENGYTRIANEILEALGRTRIPGEARQVLDVIIRRSYGFGKKRDRISLSQFVEATGIVKPHVVRALNRLHAMNIITKEKNGRLMSYGLNKDYTTWHRLHGSAITKNDNVTKNGNITKNGTPSLPDKVMAVTRNGNEALPKMVPTKERKKHLQNKSLKKERRPEGEVHPDFTGFISFWMNEYEKKFSVPYKFGKGRDGKLVKDLLAIYGFEKLCRMVIEFFDSSDPWIKNAGFTIPIFSSQANQMGQRLCNSNTAETKNRELNKYEQYS